MPKMVDRLALQIQEATRIAVFTHVSPDGDAIGSSLALSIVLRDMGKTCHLYCEDPAPEKYGFLPDSASILTDISEGLPYDLAIAVDAADDQRIGKFKALFYSCAVTACIDHHGTNPLYAGINIVDSAYASSAELVLKLIDALHRPVTPHVAVCLFVGISTDTFHFSFNNTKSETLLAASRMVWEGMNINDITGRLYRFRTVGKTKLIGRMLNGMQFLYSGRIALMTSTEEERIACGAQDEDFEGIINYGIECDGVKIAILARAAGESVKFSFRSKDEYNIAKLAFSLGGGGHSNAAGCTIHHKSFDEAIRQVVDKAARMLNEDA